MRMLLVDDHAVFRAGLRHWLTGPFPAATFGEAGTMAEAKRALATREWDVVLLDLDLPDGSGVEILEWLRASGIATPALILSLHAEAPYARRALRAGALGYVSKD
ncbi:response regulator transcription factor, partial [bacterium]|nr:response regulator transcription factor [bacterium]